MTVLIHLEIQHSCQQIYVEIEWQHQLEDRDSHEMNSPPCSRRLVCCGLTWLATLLIILNIGCIFSNGLLGNKNMNQKHLFFVNLESRDLSLALFDKILIRRYVAQERKPTPKSIERMYRIYKQPCQRSYCFQNP